MAHHTAFYQVVTDIKVVTFPSTNGSNTQELVFKTTHDVELNDSQSRPLLCFLMDPSNGASIKLEVFIRDISGADRKITTWNLKGGGSRWTMEPIKPEWVRKNSENKLIFKVDIDAGSLDIKNVVVFYQRYIS